MNKEQIYLNMIGDDERRNYYFQALALLSNKDKLKSVVNKDIAYDYFLYCMALNDEELLENLSELTDINTLKDQMKSIERSIEIVKLREEYEETK